MQYILEKAKDIEDSSQYDIGSRTASNVIKVTPTVYRLLQNLTAYVGYGQSRMGILYVR